MSDSRRVISADALIFSESSAQTVSSLVAELILSLTVPSEQISWLGDASPAIERLGLPAYEWSARSDRAAKLIESD